MTSYGLNIYIQNETGVKFDDVSIDFYGYNENDEVVLFYTYDTFFGPTEIKQKEIYTNGKELVPVDYRKGLYKLVISDDYGSRTYEVNLDFEEFHLP